MSVNENIDPRFLFHVEDDESLRFRIGDSDSKRRELVTVDDRCLGHSVIQHGFCGEKDETKYSDGDDEEDDVSIRRTRALIHPGFDSGNSCDSAGKEINGGSKNRVVREDEEGKQSIDRHEIGFKMMITNPDSNVSNSHHNTLRKRDFASVEKERFTSVSSCEPLKTILSDPVTYGYVAFDSGALMNDATILPCGHSFGAGGLQEVKRMKACLTCSQPTSEGSEKPNLSLRIVVHAFRREEESDHIHSLKRRKERPNQAKRSLCISKMIETPKSSRGIQFPFSIGDHIIIEV